jgi:hypothetical protein
MPLSFEGQMWQYLRNQWNYTAQLWRPVPTPYLPYFVVREHVEKGFDRRRVIITSIISAAFAVVLGALTDPLFRAYSLWQMFSIGLAIWIVLSFLSITFNLTGEAMLMDDEEVSISRCIRFLRDKQYTMEQISDIAVLAAMNTNATQSKLPLPTVVLTAVATIAVVNNISLGVGVALGFMAFISLLSFATATGHAHADAIIQKTAFIMQQVYDRWKRTKQQQHTTTPP